MIRQLVVTVLTYVVFLILHHYELAYYNERRSAYLKVFRETFKTREIVILRTFTGGI